MEKYINILKRGGVIAAPTDTVYGLLADATNPDAVAKVFAIKGRGEEKALPIFVRDIAMAKTLADISSRQESFLKKVWPGKVTSVLFLKSKAAIAKNAVGDDGTIALRIPNHPFILDLLKKYKKPLTGTSANRSGEVSCLDSACVKKQLTLVLPDAIIDGGKLPQSEPSTIVDLTKTPPQIIRRGAEDKKIEQMLLASARSKNQT